MGRSATMALCLAWALTLWPPCLLGTDPLTVITATEGTAPPELENAAIRRRPSSGLRPYSLSLDPDDYNYSPKPRHLRTARLLRLLGPSFDPFWMSVEDPRNGSSGPPTSASRDLSDGAARYQRKLRREAEGLEISGSLLPPGDAYANMTQMLRAWLVDRATCQLTSSWVDLGPVFWPRWVRHTDCDDQGPSSCSWPPGMVCRRAQLTQIKLLAWHCWATPTEAGVAAGRPVQQCAWRLVPYPVVAACKCSCR
ncbi:noggin-like [Ambystoma mexicanum]|uniref:noggin-like n=1 Tax=Ambystoma mexicanum TaxID=8296 RepID=UPI0037E8A33E